jgi:hypothetical protein
VIFFVACASSTPIPQSWTNVPTADAVDPGAFCAKIECRKPDAGDVRIAGTKLMRGDKELTPAFKAIDSFDVSTARKEVVFSAKRDNDFDIGLVSIDGSDVHWVPNDPSDETGVQWGTRPNTISYVVHLATGDAVRVVHVSSSIQFLADFPYSAVHGVAWSGERMNVIVSSVDSSTRVESMKFNTEERQTDVSPSVRLDVMTEPIAGGVLLRPPALRYGETLPLVVWIANDFAWSDARAALLRNARLACAIVRREPDEAFWSAVSAMPWIDGKSVFVVDNVGPASARLQGPAGLKPGLRLYIVPDPQLATGTYRKTGNILFAPPAVVQSVAAGFIADHLKGTAAGNGSHR